MGLFGNNLDLEQYQHYLDQYSDEVDRRIDDLSSRLSGVEDELKELQGKVQAFRKYKNNSDVLREAIRLDRNYDSVKPGKPIDINLSMKNRGLSDIKKVYGSKIWKQALDDFDNQKLLSADEFSKKYPILYKTEIADPYVCIVTTLPPTLGLTDENDAFLEFKAVYSRIYKPSTISFANSTDAWHTSSYLYWYPGLSVDDFTTGYRTVNFKLPVKHASLDEETIGFTFEPNKSYSAESSLDVAGLCREENKTPVDISQD